MNQKEIEEFLLNMKGGETSYPFGPDALVYKVMGKMYALVSQKENQSRVTLKVSPPDGLILIEKYASIEPGYYMSKKHWITIQLNGEVSDDLLKELSAESYQLVFSKLTKKDKNYINNLND